MQFYSLNNQQNLVNFETALLNGIAEDGGLYFPAEFPQFTVEELQNLSKLSLTEIAYLVLEKWVGSEIPADVLLKLVTDAQNFPIELVKVGSYQVLELFHGPTLAFKDIAARHLAQLMSYFVQKRNKKIKILVATSGDTGGAIAHGFANVPNIEVVVLFPKGKVSKLQEQQLTRTALNVTTLEVLGVFDDCQSLVKQAFADPELKSLNLTSANSINIGRLIPQIIYYVYAYSRLVGQNPQGLEFVIPAGNLGNTTAAMFALRMGLPIKKIISATNENDALVDYLQTGNYQGKPTVSTLSNAMDVGNPNNFPRILELWQSNLNELKLILTAFKISDVETIETIKKVYQEYNYLLDPHTAVAWTAAEQTPVGEFPKVIVSTASALKFAQEVSSATGIAIDDQEALAIINIYPPRKTEINNNYKAFKQILSA